MVSVGQSRQVLGQIRLHPGFGQTFDGFLPFRVGVGGHPAAQIGPQVAGTRLVALDQREQVGIAQTRTQDPAGGALRNRAQTGIDVKLQ